MDNNQSIKRDSNIKLFVIIICLFLFIIMVIGVSIATFTYTKESKNINTISTGNIYLNFKEDNNGIMITNAMPINDEAGKVLLGDGEYFDFTVNAKLDKGLASSYEIFAIKDSSSTLNDDEVRLYLERKKGATYVEEMSPKVFTPLKKNTILGSLKGDMLLAKGELKKTGSVNYRLRMWLGENARIDGLVRTFSIKVGIKAKASLA